MNNTQVEQLIKTLGLKQHPEGGYFLETYRSSGIINPNNLMPSYSGKRNYSTCIYFLLPSDSFSAFHRIKQDEIWHFYKGSPIRLHTISEAGKHESFLIGNNFNDGERPQLVVNGGLWFAAEVIEPNHYALVGCTVSPGFSFEDFELPDREELIAKFPQHKELVTRLTHQ